MKRTGIIFLLLVSSFGAVAQMEQEATEGVPGAEMHWYNMPVTWIVAAGILLSLLVVLTRGGSRSQE